MAGNRAAAENYILKHIHSLAPKTKNAEHYADLFKGMSDRLFDEFMEDLNSGKRHLCVVLPNFADTGVTVENNLKLAKTLGHNFFERIWIEGRGDMPTYLTPVEYMVVDLPLKRASQLLIKKISVPDDNKTIDILTGQPTGASKGAKISGPELQVCAAMGLDRTLEELMKYRGGDTRGNIAYNNMLSKLGTANISTLSQYASGTESTKTLKTFLTCMHLKNTL